jgi:hypothetical protein
LAGEAAGHCLRILRRVEALPKDDQREVGDFFETMVRGVQKLLYV